MKKTTSLFCAFAFALGLCSTAQAFIITFNDEQSIGEATSYFYWTYECNVATKTATLIKGEQLFGDVEIKNLIVISDATTTNLYTVNKIAAGALANNPALLSVTVPNTILEIGDEAFKDCTSLAEVTLTHGVRYIGKRPFVNTIVTEINLPDSVLDVGGNITAGTLFTTKINIGDSSHFVYSDDGVLYNKDQTKLYACPARAEGTVSIPNTVTNIAADAFFGCFRLTYLNLPNTVNTIGSGAFNVAGIWPNLSAPESTPKLKSVFYNGSVPDAADDIYDGAPDDLISYVFSDDWADPWKDRKVTRITGTNLPVLEFKDAYGLTWHYRIINGEAELYNNGEAVIYPTSIDGNRNTAIRGTHLLLPSSINGYVVTKIGDYAFLNCKNLSRIDIPPSITTIGDYAFKGCAAISIIRGTDSGGEDATIEIPDNITTLGYHPFEDLKSVAVIIPRTTIETKGNPIAGMPFIATVEIDENNPKFISSDNVIYNKQLTEVVAVPANYNSSSIHFLNSTQKINCEALYGCENLRSILLPESLEYIGTNAFAKCASISALTIPATVTEIGHSPFTNCIDLLKVTYDGNAPATDNALYAGTQNQLTSFVLDTATGFSSVIWKDRPIVVISTSPDSTILHYDDGAITWYFRVNDGVAELYRDGGNPAVISDDPDSPILSISLPQTLGGYVVKGVGDGALANQRGITSISIPDTYEWIGDNAFSNCTSLASIDIPYGVRYIGARAFVNTIIRKIKVPDSLLDMGGNISAGTLFTSTISIDDSSHFVYSDDGALFNRDMTKLYACPTRAEGTIILPETLTNICADAFFGCHRLTYLNIPASVTTIGDGAFNVAGIWPGLSAPESTPHLESIFYNGTKPNAADDIYAGTPETLVSYALTDEGWTGGETWKNRKVMVISGKNPPVLSYIDSNRITWYYRIVNKEIEIYNEDKNHSPITAVSPRSTQGGLYNENDSTVYVHALRIPTSINGFAVTKIGPHAFDGCSALTLVGIPYSIREIGDFAFSNCTAIVSIDSVEEVPFGNYVVNTITLPTGVNKLGYHPFEGVQASSVSLPYTLTSTDGNPAAGCGFVSTLSVDDTNPSFYSTGNILYDKTKKKVIAVPPNFGETSVSFLPSVTEICNEALLNCRNLTTIQLPESLTSIEQMALSGCSSVAALSIPSNVTAIGSAAFSGCSSLLSVTYAGNAPTAPDDLYSGTLEALTSYASSEAEGFTEPTWKDRPIDFVPPPPPQPLIYIDGAGVAWGYQIIEDDIAEIISVSSESAITALTFPSTIYALTVKGVGAWALTSQRGITSISIPDTYEWIGDGAFSNCTSLASVTLAHGLRAIGRHPFEGTAIEAIALPDTVSSIDGNILYGCDPSVSLSVGDNNPYFAESEEGALYDKDFTTLFACPMTTESLAVPATTTNVNDDAFADCIRLASIAFLGDAPAAADGIFADTPETLVISVLDGSLGWDGDPTSSALPASGLWRDRTIVAQNHTDGTWAWIVDDDLATLYNGGDSALLDKNTSGEVVIPAEVTDSATGKKYTVVGIGDGALGDCSKVTAVTLPDTIETIGAAPFAGTKISTLSIPAHVESIDGNPAAGCAYFTGFTVDEGNISFSADDGLLYNSTQTALLAVPARATDVTVPESVTSIADDAFAGCVALANVKFLGNAPTAADDVFADTPATLVISVLDGSLGWDGDPTSSTLPASGLWRDRKIERAPGEATKYTDSTGTEWDVTIYDNKAELGANGATPVIPASTSGEVTVPGEITIDDKTYAITAIPDGAFEGCSEITSINIPASITPIAADAFNGCTSLESFSVDSKNPAYSSRNGILYSKDGKTLVNVPAKTSFAATFTEKETASKKEIVEVIGSTDPDTMTTEPNQIIELKSYGTSTSTTATEFSPSLSIDMILSGVTAISDYAFTDCGLMPEGSTVTGTLVVNVDGKETELKTGTFQLPVGTDSTGGHSYSYIYSQAGFYKGSVCLYHTASDSYKTISYAIPISIPTGISYSNLAFYNSHFTSKNKPDTPVPAPPVVVVNPPVDVPDDDSGDTNDGFGVTAILRDSNGNESAIKEGEVIEAHVGIKMSIPLSVGNAPDGSLSTVTAKGLPAGVKLAKTAVKEGRKVVKYIYAIEGTPSRAQSAKTVVLKVTNKKNKLNESVSFAIKVLAMPSWVGGKYNGVCFDGTTEIGSATATISAAGKLSGKIMVPSDDGKKSLKLSYTAKGFSDFDEESNTFYGTATMRVNRQTVDVPFALSAYDGAGQLSLELPGMTAMLEQNTWKRGDIAANSTIKVDGFTFKLAANGKVKWSGSVEGDNDRTISVSGSTQLLSGPSALVYIPPKANLVGGWCQLFQLW